MAICSTSCSEGLPTHHQPLGFKFPKRSFGVKRVEQRSFHASHNGLLSGLFLHYDGKSLGILPYMYSACIEAFEASLNELLQNWSQT